MEFTVEAVSALLISPVVAWCVRFVHVTGNSPCFTDHWTKPYRQLAQAKAQATRKTRWADGRPYGDWTATVYRLDAESMTLVDVDTPRP